MMVMMTITIIMTVLIIVTKIVNIGHLLIITIMVLIIILTLRIIQIIVITITVTKPTTEIKLIYKFNHLLKSLLINEDNFEATIKIINNNKNVRLC